MPVRTALAAADVVLTASGTATLEGLLSKRPMVVGYKGAGGDLCGGAPVRTGQGQYVAMANLLADERLAPGVYQGECEVRHLPRRCWHSFRIPRGANASHHDIGRSTSSCEWTPIARPHVPWSNCCGGGALSEQLVCGWTRSGVDHWQGPVVAAAVILDPAGRSPGSMTQRSSRTAPRGPCSTRSPALRCAGRWGAEVEEIDEINILQASLLAMQRAVSALDIARDRHWSMAIRLPRLDCPARAIVGGTPVNPVSRRRLSSPRSAVTTRCWCSIALIPAMAWRSTKGYPTKAHMAACRRSV